MTSPLLPSVAREVEFAADDHGKQNNNPLWRLLYREGAAAATGVEADCNTKHDPPSRRNWLSALYFVIEVSAACLPG
jgi:hypothetical protein